jgi:hypothetical protein
MLVEIGVINAHSPFIILFPYKDGISYPLWMDYFFTEASRKEFSYFSFNCLTLVMSKPSKVLLFGHNLWVYIQTMLDQFPGHPCGISAGFHTNMSWLARRKLTSASSYFSSKPAPMTAVLDESPSWSWIDLRATSPVD